MLDNLNIVKEIFVICEEKNLVISTAESCTGGRVASQLTSISDSSKYFYGGVVAYDNIFKQNILAVEEEALIKYGAVSKEVATQMAKSSHQMLKNLLKSKKSVNISPVSLATTGIAGPNGGSDEKPVGLVHFACKMGQADVICEEKIFNGNREEVQSQASLFALEFLMNRLEVLGDRL